MSDTALHRARPARSSAIPADAAAPAVRRLWGVGLGAAVVLTAAAGLAVVLRWPGQFGNPGSPDDVLTDAVTRGTALSPPVPLVLAFVGALWLATRRNSGYGIGCVVLVLLSAVFLVGGLGEAMAPATPDVPRAALVISGVVAVVLAGTVVVTAVQRFLAGR
jgi:hypothetical protein